jgi:hypothetical protein
LTELAEETEDERNARLQKAFMGKRDVVFNRQRIYREVFKKDSLPVQAVLKDLAKFCRAHTTTFHMDARAHALAEGRREVWLRIANHLELTSEELWSLVR